MSLQKSPGLATNEKLNGFFDAGDDKRREILRGLGLSPRREHDWTTIWAAIGLSPVQRRKLWDDLREKLFDVARVAEVIGKRPSTINGWCLREEYPPGFPMPIRLGPRTKRWIGLEVMAYRQPKLYAKTAREIARPSRSSRKILQARLPGMPLPTTLEPLPADLG